MSTVPIKAMPMGVQVKHAPPPKSLTQPGSVKGSKGSGASAPSVPVGRVAGVKGTGSMPSVVGPASIKGNSKATTPTSSSDSSTSKPSSASIGGAKTYKAPIKAHTAVKGGAKVEVRPVKTMPSPLSTSKEHEAKREAIKRMALDHGRRLSAVSPSYRTSSASTRTDPVAREVSVGGFSPLALPSSSPSPQPQPQRSVPQPHVIAPATEAASVSVPGSTIIKIRDSIIANYGSLASWCSDTDLDIQVRSNDHVVACGPFRKALLDLKVDAASADLVMQKCATGSDVSVSKFFNIITEGFTESVVKVKHVTVQAVNGVRAIVTLTPGESEEKVIMSTAARLGIQSPCDVVVVDGQGKAASLTYGRVTDGSVYFIKPAKHSVASVEASTSTASLAKKAANTTVDCATSTASLKPNVELFEQSMQSPPQKWVPQSTKAPAPTAQVQMETQTEAEPELEEEQPRQLEYDTSAASSRQGEAYSERVLRAERIVSTVSSPVPVRVAVENTAAISVASVGPPSRQSKRFATPARSFSMLQPEPATVSDLIQSPPLHHVVHESTSPTYTTGFGAAFGEHLRAERLRRGLPYEGEYMHGSVSPVRMLAAPAPTPEPTPVVQPMHKRDPPQHVAWSPQRVHPSAGTPLCTASYQTYEIRVLRDTPTSPLGLRIVGVVIEDVASRGPAERAGLKPGMLIHSVDAHPVPSYDAIQARIAAANRVVSFVVSVP